MAAKRTTPTKPTPREAQAHPPKNLWLAQSENQTMLKQILTHPVFLAARHYAEQSNRVTVSELVGKLAILPEVVLRKASITAGIEEAFRQLELLTLTPQQQQAQLEEWAHITP